MTHAPSGGREPFFSSEAAGQTITDRRNDPRPRKRGRRGGFDGDTARAERCHLTRRTPGAVVLLVSFFSNEIYSHPNSD
jgi:hypothetical protein